ncbi:hypothetical protein [Enterovibrio norvegicus]|uniref:hypothetical protein n=1 Tax=Enterovibrio norvegicus TaxID=188144 RepID=UPI0013D0A42A|nr:hypothetical protein [Enterovibrio norvegicus]
MKESKADLWWYILRCALPFVAFVYIGLVCLLVDVIDGPILAAFGAILVIVGLGLSIPKDANFHLKLGTLLGMLGASLGGLGVILF